MVSLTALFSSSQLSVQLVVHAFVLPVGGILQFHQKKASSNLQDSAVLASVSVQCKQRFSNFHSFVAPMWIVEKQV